MTYITLETDTPNYNIDRSKHFPDMVPQENLINQQK